MRKYLLPAPGFKPATILLGHYFPYKGFASLLLKSLSHVTQWREVACSDPLRNFQLRSMRCEAERFFRAGLRHLPINLSIVEPRVQGRAGRPPSPGRSRAQLKARHLNFHRLALEMIWRKNYALTSNLRLKRDTIHTGKA